MGKVSMPQLTFPSNSPLCPCFDPCGWLRSAQHGNRELCADCSHGTELPHDQTQLPLSWSQISPVIIIRLQWPKTSFCGPLGQEFPFGSPSIQLPTLTAWYIILSVRGTVILTQLKTCMIRVIWILCSNYMCGGAPVWQQRMASNILCVCCCCHLPY